jgi:SAM-dependent methyltransferase
VWLPRFVCPECRAALVETGAERFACAQCGRVFDRRAGVWRFLLSSGGPPLPRAGRPRAAGRRDASESRVQRETYHHFLGHVLAARPSTLHILDLGAGNGWLSHRVTTLGHRAVAVDAMDDDVDGLGAARHYASGFAAVQADFDALPFAPGQFDLVVFNRSLHYAADSGATLERAHQALAPGGALVVMDSPTFGAEGEGAVTADEGGGYLTFAHLAGIAEKLASSTTRSRPRPASSRCRCPLCRWPPSWSHKSTPS